MTDEAARRAIIARLNDHFRITGEGAWTYLSRGIAALPIIIKEQVVRAVCLFDPFTPNDPHWENDCALVIVGGYQVRGRIDHYSRDRSLLDDPDPADPATTKRLMTIMLAEEY